jgi:transposase-like protein
LLAATATDARGSLFPLAFAIVDAENTDNWFWFLRNLRAVLEPRTRQLFAEQNAVTILSDRGDGLLAAVPVVFPNAAHGFCIKHLERNMKAKFPKNSLLVKLLWSAGYAETVEKFEKHMESIKQINPKVHAWLIKMGPKHWAEAYFLGRRYGHLTSNISESLNSWLNPAREQPIGPMLESIRTHLMEWFEERRRIGAGMPEESVVVDTVAAELRKSMRIARRYKCMHIVDKVYEVYACDYKVADC